MTAVAVMGVLFLALGGVVQMAGRAEIMAGIDADLAKKVDEIIQVHHQLDRNGPPPPPPNGPGRPDGGPGPDDGGGPRRGPGPRGGPDDPNRGPGPGPGFGAIRRALRDVGDPLLAIGPRFVSIDSGPPFAPPEMREPYDKAAVDQAKRSGTVYSEASVDGQRVRIITKLAKDASGRRWIAQLPHPLGDVDKAINTLNRTLLILLPLGLLLTAGACLFLMQRLMKPIRDIAATTDSMSAEDLSGRLRVDGSDEFARLAGTINGMLGRLENSFALQKQTLKRLAAVLKQQRRFTADASHELKTPLSVIKANTGLMLREKGLSDDAKSSVQAIDAAASRMNRLVQGLMLLARTESGDASQPTKPFDLKIAVQNAIDQVHRSPQKVVSYHDEAGDISVNGVERDIERVFVNLVDNACRHTQDDGHIDITVSQIGSEAVVAVKDDGEGIAVEHIPHLFDRFYRADSARSTETGGTGLGLAICKGIVEAAGGQISIQSELGKGTVVTVTLPAA